MFIFIPLQLSIVASVKEVTTDDVSTDIVLVKNASNLMKAVMNTLKTAEAACVKVCSVSIRCFKYEDCSQEGILYY